MKYFSLILIMVGFFVGILIPATSEAETRVPNTNCEAGKLCNPLRFDSVQDLLPKLLDIVTQIGLIICTFFIILAGFKYVTAQGNPTEIEKTHKILLWAVIGTAVLLGAQVLASILANTVNQVIK